MELVLEVDHVEDLLVLPFAAVVDPLEDLAYVEVPVDGRQDHPVDLVESHHALVVDSNQVAGHAVAFRQNPAVLDT